MSWSLKLEHGDLSVKGASLGTVTNESKLVQDLRCFLLEQIGTDNLHPGYGSDLEEAIGASYAEALAIVEGEVYRICKEYQKMQLVRAKQDRLTYGKATLSPGEVLYSVQGVVSTFNQDVLEIQVKLATGTGDPLALSLSIPAAQPLS